MAENTSASGATQRPTPRPSPVLSMPDPDNIPYVDLRPTEQLDTANTG